MENKYEYGKNMAKARQVLANFDARIPKIEINPKNKRKGTKVIITSKMYDETSHDKIKVKLIFKEVAGIDFRVNYIDSLIGSEAFGLYCFEDKGIIMRIMKDIFKRRKEIYLLEGDYNYDEEDEEDGLNTFDLDGEFSKNIGEYKAFVQNVDLGVYIIISRSLTIEK